MSARSELQATVEAFVQKGKGKGILAADESGPTIGKRFKAIGVESSEEMAGPTAKRQARVVENAPAHCAGLAF